MIRITKPDKWKDAFFLNLKPFEKLIFIYFYENCDDAGFLDVNYNKICAETGISKDGLTSSLTSLKKAYILSSDYTKIWIKKFLLHQNRLPLDLKTSEGNYIKLQIEDNLPKFNHNSELQSILGNIKKLSKSKAPSTFVKPSVDEVIMNFKEGEWSFITPEEIVEIYDYYDSVDWKVGTKKMADWNKAFIGAFRRNVGRFPRPNQKIYQRPQQQKISKMDNLIEENKKIETFDFNTLRK